MRTRVLLAVLCFLAAGCGQKAGVHASGQGDLPNIIVDTSGGGVPGGTATGGDTTGTETTTTTGGSASGGSASGAAGATAKPGGTTAGGTSGGGAALKLSGKDRTGVTDSVIKLALHAPVTGAAPLPVTSFDKARDLYWRYVTEIQGQKVLGRSKVEVAFKDDKYTPNTAIQACRELASSAFLVVGGGGTDQIQACARFAEQSKVPYLSGGVTESGLRGLQYYFAASMSYKQQGALLAQYIKKNFAGQKVGAIVTDTPNFDDAVQGWEDGVKKHGLDYFKTLRHPRGNNSWITSFSREMQGGGVKVLFMLTAPVDYIQFAQQSAGQGFRPQLVGVGISMGLNAVLGSGCPDVDKGIFFSPFPGLDWARQSAPEFFSAGEKLVVPVDDIALVLWALAKTQHETFKRYETTFASTDLTREDYVAMLARQQGMQSGVFPQLSYSATDHFGASQVHVLQADCAKGEHKTLATFASGF